MREQNEKAVQAMRAFLKALGLDLEQCGMEQTPERVARLYGDLFDGLGKDPASIWGERFASETKGIVAVRHIPFYSVCEHHLLPFYGKAHVAYIPDGKVAGLSKLARTVEVFARRPQIQENMTAQIADAIERYLSPKGVMVFIEAEHMCMSMRGVQKPGTKTVTTVVRGAFADDYMLQQTFLQMIKK